jgi:hypothetical protein
VREQRRHVRREDRVLLLGGEVLLEHRARDLRAVRLGAVSEAQEARAYYESEREGLGGRFVDELSATLDRIVRFPDAWPSA